MLFLKVIFVWKVGEKIYNWQDPDQDLDRRDLKSRIRNTAYKNM
jgi:hypothetical protein